MLADLRRTVPAIAVAMLLGTPSLVFAQGTRVAATRAPIPAAPPRVTSVEGITEYRLANGLRVLLFPDPGKPTVTVNVTYMVGSRHEGYGETGMAHLLEHMVFKPTARRTNIPQELNAHGARFNGSTWYDRTNYYETVPSSDENLAWAIDLEADRMVNARVDKKDLETEFSVVRNEYESGENSPFRVLLERTLSTAYIWHNYGKSTIGARSDIEQMPIERLKAFYQKHYQPDNAVLTIAGKFDVDKTLALVSRTFGAIPKPVRSLDRGNMLYPTYTREPAQDGERSVTLRRTGDVQIAMVAYHVPAGPHADYAAVSVLADVLGEAPAGRLYKSLVETKQAADVGTITLALAEPGLLLAFANVRKENPLDTAVASIDRTIDELLTTNPATETEVNRVKTTQLKNIDLTLNSSERVGLGLSEYIAAGDWRLLFLNRDRLQKVSVADVNRVARLYLKPSNKTVGLFIPTDKPDRADVADAGDVGAMVKDYRGNAALVGGEAFDPTPENIDRRAVRSSLPNGLKLALLPKRTRGESVVASITLRYGTPQSLMNQATCVSMTGQMLSRGTKTKSRQALRDAFDQLKARWTVSAGVNSTTARLETTRPNLIPALRLLAEVLHTPAFDPKELDELKRTSLAAIEAQQSEPQVLALTTLRRRIAPLPKGAPNYVPTTEEQVEAISATTIDNVKAFHSGFYGASHATMSVIGDFDAAGVKATAAELFGSWQSPTPFERVASPYVAAKDTTYTLDTPDKANAFFIAALNVPLRDDDADYPAMMVADYIFGGGPLNSRLASRIRQKEGLSYGVQSIFQASSLDRSATQIDVAIYNPVNIVRLQAAFKDELAKALADGFTDDEVARARQAILQGRLQARANDAELVGALSTLLYVGRTMAFEAELELKVNALTAAQVSSAFRRYITPGKYVIVRAGDFQGKHIDPDAMPQP